MKIREKLKVLIFISGIKILYCCLLKNHNIRIKLFRNLVLSIRIGLRLRLLRDINHLIGMIKVYYIRLGRIKLIERLNIRVNIFRLFV